MIKFFQELFQKLDLGRIIGLLALCLILVTTINVCAIYYLGSICITEPYLLILVNMLFFLVTIILLKMIRTEYQDEGRFGDKTDFEKLNFKSVYDKFPGNNIICRKIQEKISKMKNRASQYELYIVKHGLSSFGDLAYVQSLVNFIKNSGTIILFIPIEKFNYFEKFKRSPSTILDNYIYSNLCVLLKESLKHSDKLYIYLYDINEMRFFKNLKIGMFIKDKDLFDEIEDLGWAYINLKDEEKNYINVTSITTNTDFLLFLQFLKKVAKTECTLAGKNQIEEIVKRESVDI